jgi:hypothetical protein
MGQTDTCRNDKDSGNIFLHDPSEPTSILHLSPFPPPSELPSFEASRSAETASPLLPSTDWSASHPARQTQINPCAMDASPFIARIPVPPANQTLKPNQTDQTQDREGRGDGSRRERSHTGKTSVSPSDHRSRSQSPAQLSSCCPSSP